MDVVEGQTLQLHIGRLGEGGCAAQRRVGKGMSIEGENEEKRSEEEAFSLYSRNFLRKEKSGLGKDLLPT